MKVQLKDIVLAVPALSKLSAENLSLCTEEEHFRSPEGGGFFCGAAAEDL